ncbi:uncharacterized protein [Zea mays]|uniref:uncharacterized protein isoform X4 n=1 Tax=Zea mays TaxID=4577 RepID=UPI001652B23E|nr:uncharacterized protein LOC109943078 isoform X4 [Zea mays]
MFQSYTHCLPWSGDRTHRFSYLTMAKSSGAVVHLEQGHATVVWRYGQPPRRPSDSRFLRPSSREHQSLEPRPPASCCPRRRSACSATHPAELEGIFIFSHSLQAMAFNYYRSTWCGSAAANKNNEEIEACAVLVATLRKKRRWGGSVVGHKMKNRDRIGGDIQLNNDYFIERSLFNPEQFRRRFRMQQSLFLEIEDKLAAANKFFRQKRNAAGVLGFSSRQKCTMALRMLAYGGPANFLDEGLRMGESTVLQTIKEFAKTVLQTFFCLACFFPPLDGSSDSSDVK